MGKNVNTVASQQGTSWIETENGYKFILKIKDNGKCRLTGSVQPLFGRTPLEFYEIGSLILALDRLMDTFEEFAWKNGKSFLSESDGPEVKKSNGEIYETWIKKETERGSIIRKIPEEEKDSLQKNTEIFFVCVRYRQFGSWQGEIKWDGKHTKYFRSELELFHLIDSVFKKENTHNN